MSSQENVVIDPTDQLPAMTVGRWVTDEKHQIIRRYIHAAFGARDKWPNRAYIDLFSGPGRVYTKSTNSFADGGVLAAWRMSQAHKGAFTHFFVADASAEYLRAAESRLSRAGAQGKYYEGRAHETIERILHDLPKKGLHLALLDPFNAGHLHFSIIERLASSTNIDIVVHLSTGDIQRNIADGLRNGKSTLDNFAPGWQKAISQVSSKSDMRKLFLEHWFSLIKNTGLKVCDDMYAVKNSKGSTMYHLCLLSRHKLANKLWTEACKIAPTRSLF
jgi:three-Cys-motif partner protein